MAKKVISKASNSSSSVEDPPAHSMDGLRGTSTQLRQKSKLPQHQHQQRPAADFHRHSTSLLYGNSRSLASQQPSACPYGNNCHQDQNPMKLFEEPNTTNPIPKQACAHISLTRDRVLYSSNMDLNKYQSDTKV